ncbi:MAG TPA: hypothetical protein VGL53_16615 [Bryobacteraceae bacterium]|jgi:hypothetical protein
MNRRGFLKLAAGASGALAASAKLSFAGEDIAVRGKRVIAECLEALGGKAFLAMQDRTEDGRAYSFYNEKLSGLSIAKIYTRHVDNPPAGELPVREREAFGKDGDFGVLFTAKKEGWDYSYRGARPLPDATVQRYLEGYYHNFFDIVRHRYNEPGMIFESQGSDVLLNEPVEVVDITDSENRVTTVYVHYSTKLPVRQRFYRRDPIIKERREEVSEFSKFRDVGGGVQWPFTIRKSRDTEKVYEIYSERVVINQGLSDAMFALDPGTKILKPV